MVGGMQDALREIRQYLRQNAYQNEEHVRLSLVCRVLHALGWDVWNPREVNAEFPANRAEDGGRVDLALFDNNRIPSVFIEVKAVGKMDDRALPATEKQVRDYNKNNMALFAIITDGRTWRFYYPQYRGEFHNRCFKHFDFFTDEVESIEKILIDFLTKESLSGDAENKAKEYLQLSSLQKAIEDCAPEAERLTNHPPFPRKPEAVVQLLERQWPRLTAEEVEKHLEKSNVAPPRESVPQPSPKSSSTSTRDARDQAAKQYTPEDFQHTRVRGWFMGQKVKSWHSALEAAVKHAISKGHEVEFLDNELGAGLIKGKKLSGSYSQIGGLNVWLLRANVPTNCKALIQLSQVLGCTMELEVAFTDKSPRAGETLKIRLSNDGTISRA